MRTFVRAVVHGMKLQVCTSLIGPLFKGRPDRLRLRIGVLSLCGQRAMFSVGEQLVITAMCGGRPVEVGIVQRDEDGEYSEVESADVPPTLRAFAAFTLAAGQRDSEVAWTMWQTVPRKDRALMLTQLVHIAHIHLRSHMGPDDKQPQWTEDQL